MDVLVVAVSHVDVPGESLPGHPELGVEQQIRPLVAAPWIRGYLARRYPGFTVWVQIIVANRDLARSVFARAILGHQEQLTLVEEEAVTSSSPGATGLVFFKLQLDHNPIAIVTQDPKFRPGLLQLSLRK